MHKFSNILYCGIWDKKRMHIGDGRCGPENGFQCPYCEGFSVGLDGEKAGKIVRRKILSPNSLKLSYITKGR